MGRGANSDTDKNYIHYAHWTLGILAAGEAYLNQYKEADDLTIIYNHPMTEWPTAARQFKDCVGRIGHRASRQSLQEAAQNDKLVVVHGLLPSPADVLAIPGMEYVGASLGANDAHATRNGIGYAWLGRQSMDSATLGLGFANPYTGRRFENIFQMDEIKSQYGYLPPPPTLPPPPKMSGGI